MERILAQGLLIVFLFALPLHAQTVANPSFEAAATGWTVTGYAGTFQPSTAQFPSLPDGKTVAWSNGGPLSQDLGVAAQANVTYTLSVFVGHRLDGHISPYTISLNAGATALCTGTGSNGDFPAGTFKQISLTCPAGATPPTGNLSISLAATGTQVDFDNVTLTSQPVTPQPFVFTLNGFGSFTFPMYAPPDCSDGSCSIVACNTTTNVCVTLLPGESGSIVIRKPSGDTAVVQVGP